MPNAKQHRRSLQIDSGGWAGRRKEGGGRGEGVKVRGFSAPVEKHRNANKALNYASEIPFFFFILGERFVSITMDFWRARLINGYYQSVMGFEIF